MEYLFTCAATKSADTKQSKTTFMFWLNSIEIENKLYELWRCEAFYTKFRNYSSNFVISLSLAYLILATSQLCQIRSARFFLRFGAHHLSDGK